MAREIMTNSEKEWQELIDKKQIEINLLHKQIDVKQEELNNAYRSRNSYISKQRQTNDREEKEIKGVSIKY